MQGGDEEGGAFRVNGVRRDPNQLSAAYNGLSQANNMRLQKIIDSADGQDIDPMKIARALQKNKLDIFDNPPPKET